MQRHGRGIDLLLSAGNAKSKIPKILNSISHKFKAAGGAATTATP